jgi:hypothetical protein
MVMVAGVVEEDKEKEGEGGEDERMEEDTNLLVHEI